MIIQFDTNDGSVRRLIPINGDVDNLIEDLDFMPTAVELNDLYALYEEWMKEIMENLQWMQAVYNQEMDTRLNIYDKTVEKKKIPRI